MARLSNPSDYRLSTTWRVRATVDEVAAILREPLDLVRWWPSVYLGAVETAPAGPDGRGRRLRLRTRGFLPYTLDWEFIVTDTEYPTRFALRAFGDFEGTGVWRLAQEGAWVTATYDWQVTARKPLLRRLAPLVRPVFEWNHRWAMRRGEESLRLELARRRAASAGAIVPLPPGPVRWGAAARVGGAALAGGLIAIAIVRWTRRTRGRAR